MSVNNNNRPSLNDFQQLLGKKGNFKLSSKDGRVKVVEPALLSPRSGSGSAKNAEVRQAFFDALSDKLGNVATQFQNELTGEEVRNKPLSTMEVARILNANEEMAEIGLDRFTGLGVEGYVEATDYSVTVVKNDPKLQGTINARTAFARALLKAFPDQKESIFENWMLASGTPLTAATVTTEVDRRLTYENIARSKGTTADRVIYDEKNAESSNLPTLAPINNFDPPPPGYIPAPPPKRDFAPLEYSVSPRNVFPLESFKGLPPGLIVIKDGQISVRKNTTPQENGQARAAYGQALTAAFPHVSGEVLLDDIMQDYDKPLDAKWVSDQIIYISEMFAEGPDVSAGDTRDIIEKKGPQEGDYIKAEKFAKDNFKSVPDFDAMSAEKKDQLLLIYDEAQKRVANRELKSRDLATVVERAFSTIKDGESGKNARNHLNKTLQELNAGSRNNNAGLAPVGLPRNESQSEWVFEGKIPKEVVGDEELTARMQYFVGKFDTKLNLSSLSGDQTANLKAIVALVSEKAGSKSLQEQADIVEIAFGNGSASLEEMKVMAESLLEVSDLPFAQTFSNNNG